VRNIRNVLKKAFQRQGLPTEAWLLKIGCKLLLWRVQGVVERGIDPVTEISEDEMDTFLKLVIVEQSFRAA